MFILVKFPAEATDRQTIYNSPYVTFSPDGQAWTTNANDSDYNWYERGTTVKTGIKTSIRGLQTGEHYYKAERRGEVPVGFWRVEHRSAQCIHDGYPSEGKDFHGVVYGRNKCHGYYNSGWMAYCADCGECITDMFMYMSKDAAESIDYLELGSGEDFAYYYLCPNCTNLEQGADLEAHKCKEISFNQYAVKYEPNANGNQGGYMNNSLHMYNNAAEYEGEKVTPIICLSQNSYTRMGYEFTGWNTKPDGSGTYYPDKAEIYNLSSADWKNADTWTGENRGIVTLYAQWKPSESTLVIDAGAGRYQGADICKISDKYGMKYPILNHLLQPPKGYTVEFETNGGNAVKAITGSQHFTEWSMNQPFNGRLKNNIYYFTAPNGNVDQITALFELDSIKLPEPIKQGSSFGGWYYDSSFTIPAGGAGDSITPSGNLTLYAQWVDLKLTSVDNYTANDKKGAVDLSWEQSDGKNKSYKIWQSRDKVHWSEVNDAIDIGNSGKIREIFAFSGSAKTYKIPYTGLYLLTAEGAQGGNCGNYRGGYGGQVSAKYWLKKGEILTCEIGGQNGYHGGGTASAYGKGGGMTSVISDLKGTLLIAGGGGGASVTGNGGDGGSRASVMTGNSGQSGMAGGGAGFQGGTAGERIVHTHMDACYHRESQDWNVIGSLWAANYWTCNDKSLLNKIYWGNYAVGRDYYSIGGHTNGSKECGFSLGIGKLQDGRLRLMPTNGNKTLYIAAKHSGWGGGYVGVREEASFINVFNQNNVCIYSRRLNTLPNSSSGQNGSSWQDEAGWHGTPTVGEKIYYATIPIPNGTTGVWASFDTNCGCSDVWHSIEFEAINFKGGENVYTVCGYTEGQVLSSKPAYGGSNYVNEKNAFTYDSKAGKHAGNGTFTVQSEKIGFVDELRLEGVTATDYAIPEPVSADTVEKEALTDNRIRVSWREPKDRGTEYYHYAESYLTGSGNALCRSNTTKNILASGIQGYFTLLNIVERSVVTAENGSFHEEPQMTVTLKDRQQFLHIAAVDAAGNISETTHIALGEMADADVAWKVYTKQLEIAEGLNVYPAQEAKCYYVRCDGVTPSQLLLTGYMDGTAKENYQINYAVFRSVAENISAINTIFIPCTDIRENSFTVNGKDLSYSDEGTKETTFLSFYPYSVAERQDSNRKLVLRQKFTLNSNTAGKAIEISPSVGTDYRGTVYYSDQQQDRLNGLTIIGDSEAPVIRGLEILENKKLIDRLTGDFDLTVSAVDDLSGVGDFYVEINNQDNAVKKKFIPEEDGIIHITLTKEEPVFSGDFSVTACAVDHVGNERKLAYGTTEFSLSSRVERILEPHEPVFKGGESGILSITTYGYADRVEVIFPEEMTEQNPKLNQIYQYTDTPQYKREESVQFMIPLKTPVNAGYTITVRAYKGDKQLEEHPSLSTVEVSGSILEELRTRLR